MNTVKQKSVKILVMNILQRIFYHNVKDVDIAIGQIFISTIVKIMQLWSLAVLTTYEPFQYQFSCFIMVSCVDLKAWY